MFIKLKKYLLVSIILLFTHAISAADKPVVNIQHWKTQNAVPVYFVATPELPIIDMQIVFAAGAGYDGENPGLAMLTNNMLNQGADKLDADQIAEAFDKVGAQFYSNVDYDMATVGMRSLTDPKLLTPAFNTFLHILHTPSFSETAFKLMKNRTLSVIELNKQSPNAIIRNAFYETLYNNQAYGHPDIGTIASLNALTPKDLAKFYKQYYVTKNANIILVGDLTRAKAEQLANQIASNLNTGVAADSLPMAAMNKTSTKKNINFPSNQTHIMLGTLGITPQSSDYFPLIVGNYTLGGAILTSRLFNEVREKRGLAYNVTSRFLPLAAGGPFVIYLQSRNSEAPKALKIAEKTLADYLASGPNAKELLAAKKNLIDSFPLQLNSNNDLLNAVTSIAFYHLPLNYLDSYREKVQAVTAAQIHAALNKYIKMDQMITVQVGPE